MLKWSYLFQDPRNLIKTGCWKTNKQKTKKNLLFVLARLVNAFLNTGAWEFTQTSQLRCKPGIWPCQELSHEESVAVAGHDCNDRSGGKDSGKIK